MALDIFSEGVYELNKILKSSYKKVDNLGSIIYKYLILWCYYPIYLQNYINPGSYDNSFSIYYVRMHSSLLYECILFILIFIEIKKISIYQIHSSFYFF